MGAPDGSVMNRDVRSRFPSTGKYQTQVPVVYEVVYEVQVGPPVKPITIWEGTTLTWAFNVARAPSSTTTVSIIVARFIKPPNEVRIVMAVRGRRGWAIPERRHRRTERSTCHMCRRLDR